MAFQNGKILISVDPYEDAENSFDWYTKYLHHPSNEIVVLHVPEGFDLDKAQKDLAKSGQMKESMEKTYSKITELEERYNHKLHTGGLKGRVISVPSKSAGKTIIEVAKEEAAFAIVMGTRGRNKLQKALLGSVSDFVVKNAEVPVIVVRRPEFK
ncbi:DgyrCDS4145 [Dimorphilus gyrociliatus]|uniref:DgyrCDS4145 n=1 Tax=Dimorphilus gyrociliatus TaxID=2664684 RepID=A0A7I8VIP8_9ANNE|nr:DgyrCDS4145 [Dimorphilus gyrociliatus]